MKKKLQYSTLVLSLIFMTLFSVAQPVTGVWHGKIKKNGGILGRPAQLELKLIRNGDSLTGTSYYYSDNSYTRFKVKGYFDPFTGTVTWWDDQVVDPQNRMTSQLAVPLHYVTDFNCPGEGIMKLDGSAELIQSKGNKNIPVHLDKVDRSQFPDEWDLVIENFSRGASEKNVIDSVEQIAGNSNSPSNRPSVNRSAVQTPPVQETAATAKKQPEPEQAIIKKNPPTVEDMFARRSKKFVTEIPLAGDTIELNFYDHAEIDGDSISLFLNSHLLKQNILLKAAPFTLKLAVKDLSDQNELTMVAENLGTIPPNTSLMIAYINGVRYEARLESDENSSAMIRFIKPAVSVAQKE